MEKDIGLFLDDIRTPAEVPPQIKEWKVVRTYEEYVDFLNNYCRQFKELPPIISLDHDLSVAAMEFHLMNEPGVMIDYEKIGDKTGMHCLKYTVELCRINGIKMDNKMIIHSANWVGAELMMKFCNSFKEEQGLEQDCFKIHWKVTEDYKEMNNYKEFLKLKEKYVNQGI